MQGLISELAVDLTIYTEYIIRNHFKEIMFPFLPAIINILNLKSSSRFYYVEELSSPRLSLHGCLQVK